MGAPPEAPPKRRGSFVTILLVVAVFYVMFNERMRTQLGNWTGMVLEPVIGFDGRYPVLTIMIAGTLMVLMTTIIRHFTTDWLEMARTQAVMRDFNKQMMQARKDNNTYRLKKLQEHQPKIMEAQQKMSMATMKTMPYTLIVVIPLFAWLFTFLDNLPYWYFAAPWNSEVDMFATNGVLFGSSVFPHWILLYMTMSVPLGALVQKAMKYASWKERWQDRHPEVHE